VIEGLYPDVLALDDIIRIVTAAQTSEAFSSTHLEHQLEELAGRIGTREDRLTMLRAVAGLLGTPPLHDSEYCPISTRYDWLLPFASKLAHVLVFRH
jgi:hypothetical protein